MIIDSHSDTICAISTPPGIGGIAIIRVSGDKAISIVNALWKGCDLSTTASHTAHLGELIDNDSQYAVDQCVATVYRGPRSYTGEDIVELAVHGSKWVQREALALLQRNGCRMALPGEYTRRAVMNGRMDISQAEGVADVIASTSRAAHRIALSQMKGGISKKLATLREQLVHLAALLELELDFSEEDVEFANRTTLIDTAEEIRSELHRLHASFSRGNAIKEGIPVAIIGPTNAGKSSLLNALLDDDRAIVSDIHGTTRDTIEETVEIGDYLFRFIDTAGLRDTDDPIERIGIDRSRKAMRNARIVVALVSAPDILESKSLTSTLSIHLDGGQLGDCSIILGINKIDTIEDSSALKQIETIMKSSTGCDNIVSIQTLSVASGDGLDRLCDTIRTIAAKDDCCNNGCNDVMITNLRQAEALSRSLESITPLIDGLKNNLDTDLVAYHLRDTISTLSEITGEIPSSEILNRIFSSFCIGK